MDQMGNLGVWSWFWCTHVPSRDLKGLCGNRIGLAGYTVRLFFFLFLFFPPFLLCFIGIEKCGWRKACALADKIWEIIDVGLGGWQSKKTRHVLERCLVRRSALVIKDTDKKAADWRIRCRCWTCQTILKANLFCFKCGNTKSTAWGTDFLKLF